jgi:hypothetical protein
VVYNTEKSLINIKIKIKTKINIYIMNTQKEVFNKLFKEKTELATQKVELALVDDFQKQFQKSLKRLMKTEPEYGEILNKSRMLYKEIQSVDDDIDLAIASFNILEQKAKEIGINLDGKIKGNRGKLTNFKKTTTQILSELKNII